MFFCFDCETGPAGNAKDFLVDPQPPGSIKKAETLAEWEKTEKPKLIQKQLDEAALSAITGQVLAVGVITHTGGISLFHDLNESTVLTEFWNFYRSARQHNHASDWFGFNSTSFDLPFLFRRSIVNKIPPPPLFNERGYPLEHLRDLRAIWGCGDRQAPGSLDVLCRLLGIGAKTGNGADFAKLYRDESTREQALDYLRNDLLLTKQLAERLGV
jgi:3'-5' exonuclease